MTGQNVRAFRSTLLLPVLVTLPLVMVACGDDSGSDAAKTSAETSAETRAETRADNSMDCSVAPHGSVTVPVDGDGPMVTVPVPAGWERDEAAEERQPTDMFSSPASVVAVSVPVTGGRRLCRLLWCSGVTSPTRCSPASPSARGDLLRPPCRGRRRVDRQQRQAGR